jgi:hypothetical protein
MKPFIFSIGGPWAETFENSLSRKISQIGHFNMGNPKYNVSFEDYVQLSESRKPRGKEGLTEQDVKFHQASYKDLISETKDASQVLYKLNWYIEHSVLVLVDTAILDTAIGHQILVTSGRSGIPVYGVGTTSSNSILAPAYLKGIVYPTSNPDELVKFSLQFMPKNYEPGIAKNQKEDLRVQPVQGN